jgi:hypothetical protein
MGGQITSNENGYQHRTAASSLQKKHKEQNTLQEVDAKGHVAYQSQQVNKK